MTFLEWAAVVIIVLSTAYGIYELVALLARLTRGVVQIERATSPPSKEDLADRLTRLEKEIDKERDDRIQNESQIRAKLPQ